MTTLSGARGGVAFSHTAELLLMDGYQAARESRHIVHDLLGTGTTAVVIRPPAKRAGTLRILVATSSAAHTIARNIAEADNRVRLIDPDLPDLDMYFIPAGPVGVELDDTTRTHWWVTVAYREVTPT